ncbi:MAG: type II toxin-antitoxin system HicA family toxin [archaeon]|nr:type II toxin-antitoxin system HicA family toxin [archaeon]MCP8313210.1 type II toxin-antitoxin system HicA family toxin [archaeon]MCP8316056.1 type II toxin-antitoxin system HicA family toxin [archaeon]MCP8320556.1 type II toxin-antitoxin system HicA family toxin [archaeon]
MPNKLPILSGKEVIKALSKVGFKVEHRKGSHVVKLTRFNSVKITKKGSTSF